MGSCIICGTSVDGRICDIHEQDVVFEFRGDSPDQLTVDRFYRGTVDGYAEFGVFVDIGESVTGLLHRSELDQRLDSLDWEPGDTVFVKVKNVRDNGNVDLGWSIRQDESEFRGTLVDDPEADHEYLLEESEGNAKPDADDAADGGGGGADTASRSGGGIKAEGMSASPTAGPAGQQATETASEVGPTGEEAESAGDSAAEAESAGDSAAEADTSGGLSTEPSTDLQLSPVDELEDRVGELVRIEGEIAGARQTSGPTVFQLRDETGTVDCAAFEEAGVRAYPEVGEGDIVRLEGEVETRRGELQVETEALVVLEDDERETVATRMEDAMVKRARPDEVGPLAADATVEALTEEIRDAATAIRRAVLENRPVVVRHSATADGYVAGVALERATLPLVAEEHPGADAEYHFFDRRPLEGAVYDMADATTDVTTMLENRERHGEPLPLFVFAGVGGSEASLDGHDLLDVYGARRVVVDHVPANQAVVDSVDVIAAPDEPAATTATALAANVAAHVNDAVREDLRHLPAVSFWEDTPAAYADLAAEAGYDPAATREIREAIALEAFYQSYEDKRELIVDLLFGAAAAAEREGEESLASNVATQFREKMTTEVETAEANLEEAAAGDLAVLLLDAEAYTHRYEFPPVELLMDELARTRGDETAAIVGVDTDEFHVRAGTEVDVRALAEAAAEAAPSAGIEALSPREGKIEFLSGEREAARAALLEALGGQL